MEGKAYFHLPGLFEFYDLYKVFLPLFREHREYFYDRCEIGSIYGAPYDCLWGGGRVGFGEADPEDVHALIKEFAVSPRLTFSNSLLKREHLDDPKCNALCAMFEKNGDVPGGIIISSDLLLEYIRKKYPGFYFVSSTTKVLTDVQACVGELNREGALIVQAIIKVVAVIIVTKGIDDFLLQPTIYGKRTQTHPLEIFIIILMAGYVGGIFAMIFAVPAYTLLRIIVNEFFGSQFASADEREKMLSN